MEADPKLLQLLRSTTMQIEELLFMKEIKCKTSKVPMDLILWDVWNE